MVQAGSLHVFQRAFLSSAMVDQMNSPPIQARGNKATLAATLIKLSATSVTVYLEGSYDGNVWKDMSCSITLSSFGYSEATPAALSKYPFVRVFAYISGTGAVMFDSSVAFNQI